MNNPIITLEGVVKRFGNNVVVKNMNLEIAEGEFLTLLGPSGCGKTTTLRMIAGFEEASEGIIKVEGERVEDKEPFQRNVNTVFQNYALFPHIEGISEKYRGHISHLVMHAVTQRIDAHIERINCHPMPIRRYYRQFDY